MDKHLTNVGSSLNGITGILTVNSGGSLLGGSTYDIDIRSTGRLNLCGTITARDLVFSNGSIVNVCPSGSLSVSRDFQNKNNSNSIVIDGTFTVGGSYVNGNGGIIAGTGTINITNGPVTNTGSTYGCQGFDPCAGIYPCTVASPCLSPLPVGFLFLQAEWINAGVLVSWITSSEVNNNYFEVQRSSDSRTFRTLSKVPGHGTTSETHHYSFTDKGLPPMQNILYYRIRQVDFDGQFSYSSIAAVKKNLKSEKVSIYPNPMHGSDDDFLNVTLQNISSADFTVTDARSRMVYQMKREHLSSSAVVKLPLSNLAPGMYFLKIFTGQEMHSFKLVVCE